MVDGRTFKDFALGVCGDEKELVVRRKSHGCDCVSEVEVSDDDFLYHIDDQGKSIDVNADEGAAIG